MKIIDADKLHYKQVYIQTEKGSRPALVVFAKEIRKMPEIVRCKDCICCDRDNGSLWCGLVELHVDGDHFCAWGEKKDG